MLTLQFGMLMAKQLLGSSPLLRLRLLRSAKRRRRLGGMQLLGCCAGGHHRGRTRRGALVAAAKSGSSKATLFLRSLGRRDGVVHPDGLKMVLRGILQKRREGE